MNTYDRDVREEGQLARLSAIVRTVPGERLRKVTEEHAGQPGEGSLYDQELQDPAGGQALVGDASAFALLWLLDACPQYFDALDGVYSAASARRHAPRALIRPVVEHVARAAWLMDPRIGPRARGARALLAAAVSANQLAEAMKGASREAQADASNRESHVRRRIAELFGDDALSTPNSWAQWSLDGESFLGQTKVVETMADRYVPPASGRTFYMLQSVLLHPSPASARAFTTRQDDGLLQLPDFDPTFTLGSTTSALMVWKMGVEEALAYHGWRCTELDSWWTVAESELSSLLSNESEV